ncbi:MAG: RNA polymerase sigma factor RpoD/SigA [Myxococcota bacterium]
MAYDPVSRKGLAFIKDALLDERVSAAEDGAGPASPAVDEDGENGAQTPEPKPPRQKKKPGKKSARARSSSGSKGRTSKSKTTAEDASKAEDAPEPELIAEPSKELDDEVSDTEDDEPEVLDVPTGATLPSLPSIPSTSSKSVGLSAPAARATGLERFLAEVGRYPVLTPEEERELTLAYYQRQDPIAARKLVVHNLRLVVKLAYKYRRAWTSILDLVQEGNVGLVEAVGRFDPFKGAKFSTYATFWIRAYILRFLLEHSRTVRLSRTRVGRKLFFQLSRERAKLRAQGIEPGPRLLAERLGVDQGELEEVVRHMDQPEVRLDAPMSEEGSGATLLDSMTAEGHSPEAETFRRELTEDVSEALNAFAETLQDEREVAAWEEHLLSEDPVSLSELGARFGVTKQRMGQIVAGIRKRLKGHLVERLGPDVELGFQFDE